MTHSNQHITINKLVGKDAIEAVRAEYRKELEALLLGEGAPEDMEVEEPGYEPPVDMLVAADQAFNQANKMWRRHIHNVLHGSKPSSKGTPDE